jgi:hypothetical protein
VYAVVDANRNGARDRREAYDSTVVTVDSSASAVLWAFVHDTVGPRLRTVDHVDSLSARLSFSQPLDPALRLDTAAVQVLALPDSTPATVRQILTPAQFDSLLARERAADSARRAAADTAARPAPLDTAARRPPAAPLIRPGAPPPTAAGDTAELRALLRSRPVPADRLVLRMATPFTAGGRYLVRVRGARNLTGAAADGQAVLAVPAAPPAPPDSAARAPADTTRRP